MASDLSLELALPLAPREREPEFLARAIDGDHEAYAKLVRPYERVAYRVAAAITGRNADAEEAMQNGFVKAYRSLHRFRIGAAFKPWLLRIVVNEAHNVLRAERRHVGLATRAAEQHETATAGADEAVIAREEVETVLGALARLSGRRSAGARAAVLRRAAGRRGRRARGDVEGGVPRPPRACAATASGAAGGSRWLSTSSSCACSAAARELDERAPAFDLGLLRSVPRRRIRGRVVALACVAALAGVAAAPAAVSALQHLFDVDEVPELGPLAPGVAPPFAGRSVPVNAVQDSVPFRVRLISSLGAPDDARRARRHHGRDGHDRLRGRADPADAVADDRRARAHRARPRRAAPRRTSRSETCRPSGSRAPRGGRSRSSEPTERFTARASRSAPACCCGTTTR